MCYNKLSELDPADLTDDDRCWFLDEDLLQISHSQFNRLLDVGWYPAGNIGFGAYGLVLYNGDCQGARLFQTTTPDRAHLVTEIERLLQEVCDGRL